MYCVNCGAENSEDSTFCNQCGLKAKEVNNAAQGSSQDSPWGKRPVPPKHPHIKHPDPYPPDINTSANRATYGESDERTTADPQYPTNEPTGYPADPPSESPSPLSAPSTPGISVGGGY